MKFNWVVILTLLGLVLPTLSLAKPTPMAVKEKIINELIQQTKQAEMFAEQFNKLRKTYPTYEKEITDLEKIHEQLLREAETSLTRAYHHTYYMRHMIPTLEKMYNLVQSIKEPAAQKACIKVLNHAYRYSTARDTPSTYSYKSNLKHMTEVAISEESQYRGKTYAPVWAEFYKQFDFDINQSK